MSVPEGASPGGRVAQAWRALAEEFAPGGPGSWRTPGDSGPPLGRRGWRDAGVAACLRELLEESGGWLPADADRSTPLVPPTVAATRVMALLTARLVEEEAFAERLLAALSRGEVAEHDRPLEVARSAFAIGRVEGARRAWAACRELFGEPGR